MANHSRILDALGDPTRRALFEKLGRRPAGVGELAEGLPISRPAVSQHLKVLRDAGLVACRPAGTRRIYSVDQRGVEAMKRYFDTFWDRTLAAFKAAAEKKEI